MNACFFTKKIVTLVTASLFALTSLYSQEPYIEPGTGIGQYGFLEKDALTFVRMNSNTYGNIQRLRARFFVGQEYIYNVNSGGCTGANTILNTSDYSPSNFGTNWVAGASAFVSVYATYCTNNESHCCGQTGFNERTFRIADVDNSYAGAFDPLVTDNPGAGENLVGSFTLGAGSLGLTLSRLWLYNTGSAQESDDIPNDGIRLYYETATGGTERFNGNEPYVTLYGDYGGNSATNEEWGSDNVGISIPNAGLRLYVVVADLTANFNKNRSVNFQIINDGISLTPAQNGSYTLMRVNPTLLNASASVLPVRWLGFSAAAGANGTVQLRWSTATEFDNALFRVERSADARSWTEIGSVPGRGASSAAQQYSFSDPAPLDGRNYYRLAQVDFDGAETYSAIVQLERPAGTGGLSVAPNPLEGQRLTLRWSDPPAIVRAWSADGQLLRSWAVPGEATLGWTIDLSELPRGLLLIQADSEAPVRIVRP